MLVMKKITFEAEEWNRGKRKGVDGEVKGKGGEESAEGKRDLQSISNDK